MDSKAIIGGVFGLEIAPNSAPCFHMLKPHLGMVNARSCFWALLQQLKPGTVWLPSYLCDSLLSAIGQDTRLRFYPIGEKLSPSPELPEGIERGDLIVTIAYFGFRRAQLLHQEARRKGAWVLEDASQAFFLEGDGQDIDFSLHSPRKITSAPDGGLLLAHFDHSLPSPDLKDPDPIWWLKSLEVLMLRREFDKCGVENEWFTLFRAVEEDQPTGPFRMSALTRALLSGGLDWTRMADQRRANYQTLASELRGVALFPDLGESTVPLGFPIRVENRDNIQRKLFGHQIFSPVHWKLPEQIDRLFPVSRQLSEEILTLPCDHRYDEIQMIRMADILKQLIRPQD